MMGGVALASTRFLKQFTKNVDCLSIINKNIKKVFKINKLLKGINGFIFSNEFPDIIKQRYIQKENKTLTKNYLL